MARVDPGTYLYVVGYEAGPCKVGYSYQPEQRERAMQRGGAVEAVLLERSIPINSRIATAAERYAHWLLRDHHLGVEWFNVTKDVAIAAIRKAVEPEIMRDHDYRDPIPMVIRITNQIKDGEFISTKFPAGTNRRIADILGGPDGKAAFIREAVEAELKRRERGK